MNRYLAEAIGAFLFVFAASGAVALAVALVTVGFQVLKAALANPVESSRYE